MPGTASNTQRSLQYLRKQGYNADLVERLKIRGGGTFPVRVDCFGFGDVLAFVTGTPGALLVQSTSKQQIAPHLRKYRKDARTAALIRGWLGCGNRLVIYGWHKVALPTKAGNTIARWAVVERWVRQEDFD